MVGPPRKRPHAKLVVKEHAPWRQWLVVGGSTALIALIAFGLYRYTVARMPYEWERAEIEKSQLEIERDRLQERVRDLRAENTRLAERIVLLERTLDIDHEATKEQKQSLAQQQQELAGLKEQLAFYRGIVSPEQSRAGVRVYQLAVRTDPSDPGLHLYDLVLIQSLRHDRTISGRVTIQLRGLLDGRQVAYDLGQLPLGGQNALTFSFKYFQQLGGTFRLPSRMQPTSVRVVLEGDGSPQVEESYKWDEVFRRSGD